MSLTNENTPCLHGHPRPRPHPHLHPRVDANENNKHNTTAVFRCLMAWKAYAVTRRCQLRSARSFLLARNARALRVALEAWRDGRRGRAEAARKLWGLGRVYRTAALREGLRRLGESARRKELQEAVGLRRGAVLIRMVCG